MTERENAATSGVLGLAPDGNTKSGRGNEGGRGGRKKYVNLLGQFMIHFLIAYYLLVHILMIFNCVFPKY